MTIRNIGDAADRKHLKNLFSEAGWDLSTNRLDDKVGGPVVYCVDVESGKSYAAALTVNAIEIITNKKKHLGLSFEDVCDGLGSLLDDVSCGKVPFGSEARNVFVSLAALYISQTRCYATAQGIDVPRRQFVVLRHTDANTGGKLLRPAFISTQSLLSPEQLEDFVNQVLEIDRKNHPERFPRAKLLQFRLKSQQ